MTILSWRAGLAAAVLAFAGYAAAQPATPQQQESARQQVQQNITQPYNNAPVWREVRTGQPGFTQLGAAPEQGVLIQSRGETWRQARVPVSLIGGLLVALAMLSLGGFYAIRGSIPVGESGSKMMIQRFRPSDRYAHWTMAIVWVTLAITGLILTFGKVLLLPIIGHTLYSWLAVAAKNVHNFIGPILIVGVVWMIVRYLRHNWFNKEDFVWMTKIVGNLTGHEYPSGKFNGGEKMVFWLLLVLLTPLLIVTGTGAQLPELRADPRHDADLQRHPHGAGLCGDRHGLRAHLPGHDRHEGGLPRHAQRLRHGRVGQASPRALVQRRQGRQGAREPDGVRGCGA